MNALSCTDASMTGSGTDACTVTLNAAAGSGGLSVSLSSSDATVTLPATVTVPANATSASFSATIASVTTAKTATLTATAGSVAETFTLQLNVAVAMPALAINATSILFGNVDVNTVSTQSVTLTSSGTAPLTISAGKLTGAGFSMSGVNFPVTLNAGETATLTVQFDPTAPGAFTGQLTLTSNSSTNPSTAVILSGSGTVGSGTVSSVSLSCSSASMTGTGSDACTVTLNAAAPSGGLQVSLSSSNTAVTVPASVTIPAGTTIAAFSATIASVTTAQTATLTAAAGTISNTFALQLNAAEPTLSINATSVGFGNVTVNTSATQAITLTSTGTAPVAVSSATLTGSGFTMSGATLPVTLNLNQTASLYVQFDPKATGAATGLLTLVSNSSTNPTALIPLSGTGVATSYEVDLTWEAPSSSTDPVAGYHIHRSANGGSTYQLLNSTDDTLTTYADTTVQDGLAYIYYVTSVDASGVESVPSNPATVSIP